MQQKYYKKLSPATKKLMMEVREGDNPEVNLLIRIDSEISTEKRSQLQPLVIEFRSVSGDVIALVASFNSIIKIASLGFVRYIDVSSPLYLEVTPNDQGG